MKSTLHFDYLRDGAPEVVERLRAARIPRELQSAACSVAAAFFVLLAAWGIETYRVTDARGVEALAQQRVEISRADLARTDLARTQIEKLLRLDARLSDIRLSGARLSVRLADIA
ncbi:MAG TPA: hypothetical protein VGN11_03440, partial [Candidatus Baltobacteraceae bacterium]|nr:hypothetical protein [Candidatus Baltobacteraceae bacterium]